MKALLRFELMKFIYHKQNILILLGLALALFGMVLTNSIQDRGYWATVEAELEREKWTIESEQTVVEAELIAMKDLLKHMPELQDRVDYLEKRWEFLRVQRTFNIRQVGLAKNYTREQAIERLELWLARDRHLQEGLVQGATYPGDIFFLYHSPLQVQQRLTLNETLLREGIEPLNSPYEMTGTNFLYILTQYPWTLLIFAGQILLCLDLFSADTEGGAYKVLYSQPSKRSQVFAAKFLLRLAIVVILVTGLVLLTYILVSLLQGFGDARYPTLYLDSSYQSLQTVVNEENLVALVAWSSYIVGALPMYLLLTCFFVSLTGAASLLLGNSVNALSIAACLLFLDYSLRNLIPHESGLYMAWPFVALGLRDVLQGTYSPSALGLLIMLGAYSLIILVITMLVLGRQDMKGGAA